MAFHFILEKESDVEWEDNLFFPHFSSTSCFNRKGILLFTLEKEDVEWEKNRFFAYFSSTGIFHCNWMTF
jgi:hypothetical protein